MCRMCSGGMRHSGGGARRRRGRCDRRRARIARGHAAHPRNDAPARFCDRRPGPRADGTIAVFGSGAAHPAPDRAPPRPDLALRTRLPDSGNPLDSALLHDRRLDGAVHRRDTGGLRHPGQRVFRSRQRDLLRHRTHRRLEPFAGAAGHQRRAAERPDRSADAVRAGRTANARLAVADLSRSGSLHQVDNPVARTPGAKSGRRRR